jgi:hypothetical protein
VLATVRDNPQWNFLFLTKFPKRIAAFEIPANAWMGTTVDLQVRAANVETAFAKLREKNKDAILWLSVEPMLEPIKFKRLDLFNWLVMGGAARSMRTPEFRPPGRWVMDLVQQADAVNCKIFQKTNLLGNRILELPFDAPIKTDYPMVAPDVFHYLGKRDEAPPPACEMPDIPDFLRRAADDDARTLDRIHRQQLAAHDPGEPD